MKGDLGLVSCQLLVPWIILSELVFATGEVMIDPPLGARPDGDLVVDVRTNFSLTCRGDTPLAWAYNDYDDEEKSLKEVKSSTEHGQEVSQLMVTRAHHLDTGEFTCYPASEGRASLQAQTVYVYVRDPENYLAVNDSQMIQTVHQFGMAQIPCKPTDPDLQVTLTKDGEEVPDVTYNPHVGFEFYIDAVHHSGQYSCVIGGENVMDFLIHVDIMSVTTSVERPHVHVTPDPVVEGADVTFDCSVHYGLGVKVYLSWAIPQPLNGSSRIHEHEEIDQEMVGEHVTGYIGRRRLKLINVSTKDEGVYTCHVVDHASNHNSMAVNLTVIKAGDHMLELKGRGYENGSQILVNPGQPEVHLFVGITAHPPAKETQWYDNHMRPIVGRGEDFIVENDPRQAKLTIRHPSVHNSGTYTLVVNNKYFNKSIRATLLVKGEPELIVNKDQNQAFYLVNKSYTVDCDVFAYPRPNVTWYFKTCPDYPKCDSQFSLIPPSQYKEQELASENPSPFKSMVEIRAENTGVLECRASNSLGSVSKDTMVLITDVEDGLAIEAPGLVVETDNVTLSCGASKYNYSGTPEWLKMEKNGNPSPVKEIEMLSSETKYSYFNTLLIPRVDKNHSGVYVCSAKMRYERNRFQTREFTLDVKDLEKPVIHKNVSTKASVRTGDPVRLHCHVKGSPPPLVTWYMNGERIRKETHKNIELKENNQTLSIGGAGLEHNGRYECRASNKAGSDELVIDIEITDIKSIFFTWFLWYILPLLVILLLAAGLLYCHYVRKYKRKIKELKELGLEYFENGKVECINPDMDISEQADLLPYDRQKWEFPRDKLKLGKSLGSGAFGMVMKAEAYELMEPGVATTVAVKMVKRNADSATIRALASELKILIHLGKHLNVVNVLGACTGDLNKRELLVIVEYCRYGNLRQYLLEHRAAFINQVNPQTGQFDSTFIEPMSPSSISNRFSYSNGKAYDSAAMSQATDTTLVMSDMSVANNQTTTPVGEDGYLVSRDHEWRNKDRGEYKDTGLRPVCTQDLICWAFQVARGMEYLASRKVLHGDLAARNILLAEDNIVKICDFGLSKSVYKYSNYKKKGEGPLPVKWMALESIRDQVFSTQSDVWSYGITVWELFSLGCTPYPGLDMDKGLFQKLAQGYRMEKPKYATKQVYQVMLDCWHENPHSRPSFTELAERMGGMLEDTVRTHYVDLNDPYLQQNSEFLAQQDYLSMLHSPSYVNWTAGYTAMKPASPRGDEAMELTPMLSINANESDSQDGPEGSPVIRTKPIGNDYVNVTHVLGFSNPSYQNLGRPKKSPYVNVPHG